MSKQEILLAKSAFKHGVRTEDISYCMNYARRIHVLQEDPTKWLYLGFNKAGIPLEVISIIQENGSELVIHAMKQTKKYN